MNSYISIPVHEPISLQSCFVELARRKLGKKEKQILRFIHRTNNRLSVTRLVKQLVSELHCSESSVWSTLASLRSLGFIIAEKGGVLNISEPAKIVVNGLKDKI